MLGRVSTRRGKRFRKIHKIGETKMKVFLDTADINLIKEHAHLIDGVTTNPSLAAKVGANNKEKFRELIVQIMVAVKGPVSAEVISVTYESMITEIKEIERDICCIVSKIPSVPDLETISHLVIKLPTTPEGLKALKYCSEREIKTNMTLVFQPLQALLVAKLGATYVSPFLGRLDDIGQDSMAMLKSIRTIYNNYQFKTQILAASLRSPKHVLDVAEIGADVATLPPELLEKMLNHPLTDEGLEQFLKDWNEK